MQACQDLALFAKIADTAGKKLTVASFTKAGYSLKNITIPGSGGTGFVREQSAVLHRTGARSRLLPDVQDSGERTLIGEVTLAGRVTRAPHALAVRCGGVDRTTGSEPG